MELILIGIAIAAPVGLVVVVIRRAVKEKRRREAELEQRRKVVAAECAEAEALREQQKTLLAMSNGSSIEYEGHTHFVTSVVTQSINQVVKNYRFMLSGGLTHTPHWLDIQVRTDRSYVIWFVEQKEWDGHEPDFDTRQACKCGGTTYRLAGLGSIPCEITEDGGKPYDSRVRSLICTPVEATYPPSDPTSLLFEQIDDGPWVLALRKEISAWDIANIVR